MNQKFIDHHHCSHCCSPGELLFSINCERSTSVRVDALTFIKYVYENILYDTINIFVDWIEVSGWHILFVNWLWNENKIALGCNTQTQQKWINFFSLYKNQNRIMCINFAIRFCLYILGHNSNEWILGDFLLPKRNRFILMFYIIFIHSTQSKVLASKCWEKLHPTTSRHIEFIF